MMRNQDVFLTVDEAVKMMPEGVNVDRFHLYRERKRGKIIAHKFGGRIYFKKSEVEKYIKQAAETV